MESKSVTIELQYVSSVDGGGEDELFAVKMCHPCAITSTWPRGDCSLAIVDIIE